MAAERSVVAASSSEAVQQLVDAPAEGEARHRAHAAGTGEAARLSEVAGPDRLTPRIDRSVGLAPRIRLRPRPITDVAKRVMDIVLAVVLLVLTAPLVPVIALAVFVESPGPVLFRQQRCGRGGRRFAMLKVRSMRTDAEAVLHADQKLLAAFEANGFKFPDGEDPRITRVGAFLRASSLDELPQLVNVLRGEMSLVGPRPPIIEQIPVLYGSDDVYYFSVRPGMTGPWQVSGRSDLSQAQRRALDVEYVQNRSVRGDVRILARTIPAVLRRRGAH
jgi:lipopolysaccharide/colanic/teichoic acid biosynthesis glycosyltransferase